MTKRGQNSRRKRRARYRNDREYMCQSFNEYGIADSLCGLVQKSIAAVNARILEQYGEAFEELAK